ncbi:hypothetical protein [Arthrobacter castelli]|uniref:hypothetical protein n=1 Tax=Arthrobacter castelli TaxID=271431 RepID=UPI00047C3F9D|nr:hypothetical protein [Arthrobacter castelli]
MQKMKKAMLLAPAVALGLTAMGAAPAMAEQAEQAETTYSTTLGEVNNSAATGLAWVEVDGSQATVTIQTKGLAETFKDAAYPHVQHIHIGAQGTCPTMADDANGDGIISTVEGKPAYGKIGTTLSVGNAAKDASTATDVTVAPSGASYTYKETFKLNEKTQDALAGGTGVVVVHGLDPANQPAAAAETKSNLAPKLPLAATAPALCGSLEMMPAGGADTGVTQTEQGSGTGNEMGMMALGGGLIAAAGAGYVIRRNRASARN